MKLRKILKTIPSLLVVKLLLSAGGWVLLLCDWIDISSGSSRRHSFEFYFVTETILMIAFLTAVFLVFPMKHFVSKIIYWCFNGIAAALLYGLVLFNWIFN